MELPGCSGYSHSLLRLVVPLQGFDIWQLSMWVRTTCHLSLSCALSFPLFFVSLAGMEGCRLLGLPPAAQIEIFGMFQRNLEAVIAEARKEGKYDEGIVDVKAFSIQLASEPKVSLPPPTFAPRIRPSLQSGLCPNRFLVASSLKSRSE